MLRDGSERQRLTGADHGPAVKFEPRHGCRRTAGGQQHSLPLDGSCRIAGSHLYLVAAVAETSRQFTGSAHPGDTIFLEEKGDTVGQLFHHVALSRHHPGQIQPWRFYQDAVTGKLVPGQGKEFRGVEECLARDAPLVEADSSQCLPLLHHCHFHPQLRPPDGGYIAPWAGADYDEIKLLIGHIFSFSGYFR